MSAAQIISILGVLITGAFTVQVINRWRVRRKAHLLAWGLGLAFYCLGMLSQVILSLGWDATVFRLWYWSGALVVAPWLGQGTVFLLMRKGRRAQTLAWVLAAATILGLVWLFLTPLDASAYDAGSDVTLVFKQVMPAGGVRILAPILNIWGTITLVGGAIYSALLFKRKAILQHRMVGNIFIAIGGTIPAFGGTLVLMGYPEFKYLAELLGAIIIFVGYWLATSASQVRQQQVQHA